MTNDQFKSAMVGLKNATECLLNTSKGVFEALDDDTRKKLEFNIDDVMYALSSTYREIDMLEWRVRNENFY